MISPRTTLKSGWPNVRNYGASRLFLDVFPSCHLAVVGEGLGKEKTRLALEGVINEAFWGTVGLLTLFTILYLTI